eukprot:scaffold28205_cov20-Tisochrysis_lutea.AAC.1
MGRVQATSKASLGRAWDWLLWKRTEGESTLGWAGSRPAVGTSSQQGQAEACLELAAVIRTEDERVLASSDHVKNQTIQIGVGTSTGTVVPATVLVGALASTQLQCCAATEPPLQAYYCMEARANPVPPVHAGHTIKVYLLRQGCDTIVTIQTFFPDHNLPPTTRLYPDALQDQ